MRPALSQLATVPALLRHRSAPRDEIVAFQNRRLRALIEHAYDRVPYYRSHFDRHRVVPADIRSLEDLAAIPVTTKTELQNLPAEQLLARGLDPERLIRLRTSGATGRPFTLYRNRFEQQLGGLIWRRAMNSMGVRRRDRVASIQRPQPGHLFQHMWWPLRALGLYRRIDLSCFDPPAEIAEALADYRPTLLTGFPGVLSAVVQEGDPKQLARIRPKLIITGSEVLTPHMRARIERTFAAPILEVYASHEFQMIGWQCAQTGDLHTCDDAVIAEVWSDGAPASPGEAGDLVATSLISFDMPFIRFDLGDVVERGPLQCGCGLPFGTLRAIKGRMLDYFRLPGGRIMHPYEITNPIRDSAWIGRYQLVQLREDHIVLRIVVREPPAAGELAQLEHTIADRLGAGVELRVEQVDNLDFEPSGKFRTARSLLRSDYAERSEPAASELRNGSRR